MSDGDWQGRNVLVLGLGETGLSSVGWLARRGARLRVADSRPAAAGAATLRERHPQLEPVLGPFQDALLAGMDTIVASPGIALREPLLRAAVARGIEVVGDVEIFAREVARLAPGARVLGITGTNGKSTVTALAGAMGERAGLRTVVAGNIGTPVLDALDAPRAHETELFVLELSSYQLETTSSLQLAAAAMLNVTQDHLDRYDSMADYARAKQRIFAHAAVRVLNRDDAWSMGMRGARNWSFGLGVPSSEEQWGLDERQESLRRGSRDLLPIRDMAMKGLHNAANALAAHALLSAVDAPEAALAEAIREFRGLPHRVELVAQLGGVRFYDDSKGTNVGATVAALEGFRDRVVLIAGGDGKGQDFSPLAPAVKARARAVVLIGRDAPAVQAALAQTGVPVQRVDSMEDAVKAAHAFARDGDAVLLSPACASLDMFRNYNHRGDVFAAAARALAQGLH